MRFFAVINGQSTIPIIQFSEIGKHYRSWWWSRISDTIIEAAAWHLSFWTNASDKEAVKNADVEDLDAEVSEQNIESEDDVEVSDQDWRKQRQQSGFPRDGKDFDIGLSFEDGNIIVSLNRKKPAVHPGDRLEARHDKVLEGVNQEPYKKIMGREFKESKYGFGGKKARRSKILLRQLTNDMRITLLGKREVTELRKSEVKESLENKTTGLACSTTRRYLNFRISSLSINNLETGKKRSYNEFGESLPTLMVSFRIDSDYDADMSSTAFIEPLPVLASTPAGRENVNTNREVRTYRDIGARFTVYDSNSC
ncbi:hypothetical protein DCAR_0417429 [Daucus carota subsp. sativus]|uniref:Uncharacterized protein n=1 Tax=Daucus carota subsp. sativus TaxID=79200 RepID=A0A165YG43_DAUCS|nr:hypothetical protein DCAR_0417429 [Daucus carota subsp. sativus]